MAGYAALSPYRPHDAYASTAELSVYVDAACRGAGVGTRLRRRPSPARARAAACTRSSSVIAGGERGERAPARAAGLLLWRHAAAGGVQVRRVPRHRTLLSHPLTAAAARPRTGGQEDGLWNTAISARETLADRALRLHRAWGGKLEVQPRVPVDTREALSLAYTPGVAAPCLAIRRDPDESYALTRRHNLVAVITDGSAVLGLGDIGPEAGMPVMEGKCVLFKAFGGVDAFPLCVRTQDVDEFVETVVPHQRQLRGDQPRGHRRAGAALPSSGRSSALRHPRVPRRPARHGGDGAGPACSTRCARWASGSTARASWSTARARRAWPSRTCCLRRAWGELTVCDRAGILTEGCPGMTDAQAELARLTNASGLTGDLAAALRGADAFIGVSAPGLVHGGYGAHDGALARSCSPAPIPCRRSCRRRRCAAARRWSPPGAATRPTRSTTSWRSPASSAARLDVARARHQPAHAAGAAAQALSAARLACGACRREDHPGTVRPARRPGRGGGGRRRRAAERRGAPVRRPRLKCELLWGIIHIRGRLWYNHAGYTHEL